MRKWEHKSATCGEFDQRFHLVDLVAENISFLNMRYVPYTTRFFRIKSCLPSPHTHTHTHTQTHTHTHTHIITLTYTRAKHCIQSTSDAIRICLIYTTFYFIKIISHNFEFPSGYVSATRQEPFLISLVYRNLKRDVTKTTST